MKTLQSTLIEFSAADIDSCKAEAQGIDAPKKALGFRPLYDGSGKTTLDNNLLAVMSQRALALFLRIPYHPTFSLSGDSGWDLEYHGLKIDVKSVWKPSYRIFVDKSKLPPAADILWKTYPTKSNRIRIDRWITRARFLKKGFLTSDLPSKRPAHIVNNDILTGDPNIFKAWVAEQETGKQAVFL